MRSAAQLPSLLIVFDVSLPSTNGYPRSRLQWDRCGGMTSSAVLGHDRPKGKLCCPQNAEIHNSNESRICRSTKLHRKVEDPRRNIKEVLMAKDPFDPKFFLAKVGSGKTILEFRKNQNVFVQGDVAETVFYIQEGKIKLTVLSDLLQPADSTR
jgi:hypothetical protein